VIGELFVGPLEAVVPVPLLADFLIEPTIQRDGTGCASLDPGARVGECRRAEQSRVVEREIRSDDLDAAQD